MSEKILIVDNEENIRELLELYLKNEGYQIIQAVDGDEALKLLERETVDLVLLDIMMPKVDGLTVCREIRKEKQYLPIIMLTAKVDEIDRVIGLELGADDYVTKPFSPRELVARVKAVLRRTNLNVKHSQDSIVRAGDIELNDDARSVKVKNEGVALTPKEYELLRLLMMNQKRAFSREQLLEQIWGYDYYGDTRTVDASIKRLRKKVETNPDKPQYILTVWGMGYKFEGVRNEE